MSAPASLTMATKWSREFQKAIELDGWGQVEEARTSYDRYIPPYCPAWSSRILCGMPYRVP